MYEAEQAIVNMAITEEEKIVQPKEKRTFSKTLLVQESVLIWIITLAFLGLAALCILKDYTGSLPWLTAMVSLPWTAYGVSQGFYYNKSKKENTKDGIKYESVMAELNNELANEGPGSKESAAMPKINVDYGI